MNQLIYRGIQSGFVGGVLLGLFFKWIEQSTGSKVYTLLLNIDFVPGVKDKLAEPIEFGIHLVVSLLIGVTYFLWMAYGAKFIPIPKMWFNPIPAGLLYGILPIGLFVPLTLISERTPDITDMTAFTWWMIGHVGYGLILCLYGLISAHKTN